MRKIFRLDSKRFSMRFFVLLTVGTALLFFILLFSYIFVGQMFDMLEKSENEQILARGEIVTSAVNASILSTRAFTTDWASWDETYDFALGKNPEHFKKYWTQDWKIKGQKYNFLVVKDLSGNDLYVKYYDYFQEKNIPAPEGFSEFLAVLAEDVQNEFKERRNSGIISPEDKDGFVFFNTVPYYICVRPILTYDEKSPSAGSLFFGRILSSQEIERLANAKNLTFTILENSSSELKNLGLADGFDGAKLQTSDNTIALYAHLPGFGGQSDVVLKIEQPRVLYQNGLKIIQASCVALGFVMLCFVGVLFYLLEKSILRPIEKISLEVQNVAFSSESIDTDAYSANRELRTLAWAINSMLERLTLNQEIAAKSTVSLNILQKILDALDTYLFVVDLETNNVLFVNERMKHHFDLSGNIIGSPCYKVMKPCFKSDCNLCLRKKLLENPQKTIVSEVRIDITGRNYRKMDMIIDWIDRKKVHLSYFIDITEIKEAESTIKKSLAQEQLMSTISQNFITKCDMKEFMNNTLEMTGKFMNAERISLAKNNEENSLPELKYAWIDGQDEIAVQSDSEHDFAKYKILYEKLAQNNYEPLIFDANVWYQPSVKQELEQKYFFILPLYVSGEFWGILEFIRQEKFQNWSESDIHLGKLIANVLSGALTNQNAENNLLHMSALINSSPQYISYINLDGMYEFFNPATYDLTGYSHDELMENGISILYDEETNEKIKSEIIPKISQLDSYDFELPLICKNGEVLIMSFSAFSIEEDRKKIGCIGIDITEKNRLEKNLIVAKDAAEKASRAKGEFLSRMSHEMRTPLNAIIGMTTIAQNATDMDRKDYCLGKIETASKHLLGVINDILDMSKIEANKFELLYGEFDLEKMLINATNMVNFQAEKKRQALIVNLEKNIPRFIIGDEQRLLQVITNLLANAVKFTPEDGRIRLNIKNIAEDKDVYTLQFEVEDNGIGISAENQLRLFNSFEQADGGVARQYGGTGLGLAISKRIVELLDGKIWLESKLGHGTKFIFTIKAGKSNTQTESIFTLNLHKENLKIMAVDDSLDTREYFLNIMQSFGLACDVAKDGFEALAMINENKDKPYNMFFIDWMLPKMNGIELTKKIREITNDNAVVFMISIVEWKEIENEAIEAGVNHFISKPLFPSTLLDSINQCLGISTKNSVSGGSFIGNRFGEYTLLMAEDVEVNREIIAAFFEDTKISVDFAENGIDALDLFKKSPEKYSLILMDIHMPEMDGYEATRKIRALDFEIAKTIPIIAMTANVFREDVESCLSAGMNDHIGKPVSIEQLFEKLDMYLPAEIEQEGVHYLDNSSVKQIEPDAKTKISPNNTDNIYAQYLPVLNVQEGLERVVNNKNLYFMLLKNFKAEEMVNELIKNLMEADFAQIKQTAHALKGTSLNLGLDQLADIAENIESCAKEEIIDERSVEYLSGAADKVLVSIKSLLESEGVE